MSLEYTLNGRSTYFPIIAVFFLRYWFLNNYYSCVGDVMHSNTIKLILEIR